MAQPIADFHQKVSRCTYCHGSGKIVVPMLPGVPLPPPRIFILGEQPNRELSLVSGQNGLDEADPSFERLQMFLTRANVDPAEIYFTTSVLCLPRDASQRPKRPTAKEVKNCAIHLQQLLGLLSPRLVIPLGHTAIQTLQWIYKDWQELRQFILNYDVGNFLDRNGVAVYPLYHTSAGSLKARSESRQIRDWQRIPEILRKLNSGTATR